MHYEKENIFNRLKLSQMTEDICFTIAIGFVYLILTIILTTGHPISIASFILLSFFGVVLLTMALRVFLRESKYRKKLLSFLTNSKEEKQ